MSIDIGVLLDRVVADVFGDEYTIESVSRDEYPWNHAYLIVAQGKPQRSVQVRATYEWFDVWIPELDVGTIMFDYDDEESEKELALRWLCEAMDHYLSGGGIVTQRKTLILRRTENVLQLDVNGHEWTLGRSSSSIPYPW